MSQSEKIKQNETVNKNNNKEKSKNLDYFFKEDSIKKEVKKMVNK